MQESELKYYERIGNWDFSKIEYGAKGEIKHLTLEDEEGFFEDPGDNHAFVIRLNDKICGYAVLYDYNDLNNSISILYYVNSNFRGKGIATDAFNSFGK